MAQTPSIWLIDDDESTLAIVERAFKKEKLACQLKIFGDSQSLLSEIQQTSALPHLLLTDYDMPGMNGLELIQWLKNRPVTEHLKIVLFSRNLTLEVVRKAESLNVYQVENKPDSFREWRELVNELCSVGYFS